MNIFICDDDNLVCEQIKTLCESYYIEHKLKRPDIYIFHSGEDILASDIKPDIVYLDIQMSGIDGIAVGNSLVKSYPAAIIIIITSFPEYLDEAMRFHVFRYLSKPLDKDRLFRNLNDALTKYDVAADQITIKTADNFYKIALQDIIFAEVINRKVIIHTITAEYVSVFNFQYWTDTLSADYFFQPHRCFIVNMYFVSRFDRIYIYLYHDRYKALLSRRKYAEFKDHYLRFIEMR